MNIKLKDEFQNSTLNPCLLGPNDFLGTKGEEYHQKLKKLDDLTQRLQFYLKELESITPEKINF